MKRRLAEADEFYESLRREGGTDDEQMIMRQAFAGMLWSKQYYGYNVARWLDGDPGLPPPPEIRKKGRNAAWRHFDAADILSMPDPWEYPWFAAWDLAFHAVTFAHIDPTFAKYQLLLLCREWFQHPNGALPAYEWNFDDVNPPVHAAAALLVFMIDGQRDTDFLKRIFHKLLQNFTWWLNREDKEGNDLFSGGFLGLDNIGAFDRSHLPAGAELEQSDATAWMFMYCLLMLRIATALAETDPVYEDFETTFIEHAVRIAAAMNRSGLWDEEDGFFYDALKLADGSSVPIKIHSMVGLLPLLPTSVIPPAIVAREQALGKRFANFLDSLHISGERLREGGFVTGRPGHESRQLSVVPPARLGRLLAEMLSEEGFLSAHGLRALSARHRDAPFRMELGGPHRPGRLRARRVDVGDVRGQLELAWARLDADQLPRHHVAAELGCVHGRGLHRRVSDRIGQRGPPARGRQGHLRPARLDLATRRGRPAAGLRHVREVPDRPGVARPAVLPRVLPRRYGRRDRRLAPDRLDRPGRAPDLRGRRPRPDTPGGRGTAPGGEGVGGPGWTLNPCRGSSSP